MNLKTKTLLLGATALLCACSYDDAADSADDGTTVTFSVAADDSRAHLGEKEGNVYPVLWDADDRIRASIYATNTTGTDSYIDSHLTTLTGSGKGATFAVRLGNNPKPAKYIYYAYSPIDEIYYAERDNSRHDGGIYSNPDTRARLWIPCTQTPTATSVDRHAMILFGQSQEYGSFQTRPELRFSHFTAYGRLSLTGVDLAEGDRIASVTLTSDARYLTGGYVHRPRTDTTEDSSTTHSRTLTVNTSSQSDIRFACFAGTGSGNERTNDLSGTALTVTVTTELGATLSREIQLPENSLRFKAGEVSAFTVDMGGKRDLTTCFEPDTESVIRNPLSGWVLYLGRNASWYEDFWAGKVGYDAMPTSEGTQVDVFEYANTAYLRTHWAMLEPEEGKYVWRDETSHYARMIRYCRERGLRIALRIVFDGRDQGQATPLYVINAGAEYYTHDGCKSPYPDDPVFQAKYTRFIEALAEDFNDPETVDFIDAFSPGKWGEAHAVIYKDNANKLAFCDWMTALYSRCFTKVPIIINYHRMIADPNQNSWSDSVPEDTEEILQMAIDRGYSLRHDAIGMHDYYKQWERDFVARWNFRRPVLMEGGWVISTHRYWLDGTNYDESLAGLYYREGHPEDVRAGEFEMSREARMNMMDLRVKDEIESWFGKAFPLVRRFIAEGGYRLYPESVTAPRSADAGGEVTLTHRWANLGWGYCPNNIQQWNCKYRVAFALLDSSDRIRHTFVDMQSDPSQWIAGAPVTYTFKAVTNGVEAGSYRWAVAIVDTSRGDAVKGINLALPAERLTPDGWARLTEVQVR